ncbi:MAG: hypothetical protein ACRC4N_16015 [Gammaproteobacteria bacterium]
MLLRCVCVCVCVCVDPGLTICQGLYCVRGGSVDMGFKGQVVLRVSESS